MHKSKELSLKSKSIFVILKKFKTKVSINKIQCFEVMLNVEIWYLDFLIDFLDSKYPQICEELGRYLIYAHESSGNVTFYIISLNLIKNNNICIHKLPIYGINPIAMTFESTVCFWHTVSGISEHCIICDNLNPHFQGLFPRFLTFTHMLTVDI